MSPKWEYLTIKSHPSGGLLSGRSIDGDTLNEHLNRLGADGWDLVTSFDVNAMHGESREVVLILKRPTS